MYLLSVYTHCEVITQHVSSSPRLSSVCACTYSTSYFIVGVNTGEMRLRNTSESETRARDCPPTDHQRKRRHHRPKDCLRSRACAYTPLPRVRARARAASRNCEEIAKVCTRFTCYCSCWCFACRELEKDRARTNTCAPRTCATADTQLPITPDMFRSEAYSMACAREKGSHECSASPFFCGNYVHGLE